MINTKMLKYYLYALVFVLTTATTFLISKLAMGSIAINALMYSLFVGLFAFTVTRLSWYLINIKELTPEKKGSLVCLGIVNAIALINILTTSLFVFRFNLGLIATVALQTVGLSILKVEEFAYLDDEIEDAIDAEVERNEESIINELCSTMLYKLIDDKLGNEPDVKRPLCQKGASLMTVKEADEAGEGALSATGLEYIKRIVKTDY